MKIAFFWQGMNGSYGKWNDGLREAMRIIEKDHAVRYYDVNEGAINECHTFQPDVVLYWEAPCTIMGKHQAEYRSIQQLPFKKILLFAGGMIRKEWVQGFDKLLVESEINEKECEALGIHFARAFGVNDRIFKPKKWLKTKGKKSENALKTTETDGVLPTYDGVMHATFAGWKRHTLFAEALGNKGIVIGRKQENDHEGYNRCVELGVKIVPETSQEELPDLLSSAWAVVNTAEYWGGGQRCTLEAMACNVPPIVMSDAPKNVEFVKESGYGLIADPDPASIRRAVEEIKKWTPEERARGRAYIESKWTGKHYADAILANI